MVGTGYSLARVALLGAWLGAMGVFGAVIVPAAFAHLPTQLAAGVLADGFAALDRGGAVIGALCVALGLAALRGRRGSAALLRAQLPALGVAAHLASALLVTPRLHALRLAAGGTINELATGDPELAEFARLHAISRALFLAAAASAAAACAWDIVALWNAPVPGASHDGERRDF
ncbi:MAG TPA: DUF4149 domain-containing protein [Myxococcota bacterium]|nr:DUF4149 domain-containing protein [Myxococcota bacterium]